MQCDLGNIIEMFRAGLVKILIALQDQNVPKATTACNENLKTLQRLKDHIDDAKG